MKSKEFIIESEIAPVKLIRRDCKPFLNEVQYPAMYKLYRGMNSENSAFFKKNVRLTDRTPSDMPQNMHDRLNKFFTIKFGAPFRNALFVSGSSSMAMEYGNETYVIFPIGEFKFLWSPQVPDLWNIWDELRPLQGGMTDEEFKKVEKEQFEKFYNRYLTTFQDTDLKAAIKSNHEIMLRCKSYYAVVYESPIYFKIMKGLTNEK